MEAPLTIQEKASGAFWMGLLGLGMVCFGYTVYELWPTSMSPNSIMDTAFEQARSPSQGAIV